MLNRKWPNKCGFTGAIQNGSAFSAEIRMNGKCCVGTYATARDAGMIRDEVMSVVGKGYCKLNFPQEDRCITDQQMRQVADLLNKHHYRL